jgi:Uncharacterized conserved protein, contains FHA domain
MSRLTTTLQNWSQKAWFTPIVAVLLFVLVNGTLFAVIRLRSAQSANPTDAASSPSPSPSTEVSPEPSPSPRPSASLIPRPTPSPRTSPKPASPSPSPTPVTSPTPSPTPYTKEDIRIDSPTHQTSYSENKITVKFTPLLNRTLKSLEVILDDQVVHTFTQEPFEVELTTQSGPHRLQAKANLEEGDPVTSGILRFGSGGIAWDATDPSPTPQATPSASP